MQHSEMKLSLGNEPCEIHYTAASDGWNLALRRYPPGGEAPHGEPVLLQHGLGCSSKQFDLGVSRPGAPVPSLARWLSGLGYDVWAGDLRGSGRSERPGRHLKHRWDWAVDDFIEKDIPAFLDYILAHSRHDRLHWVGHSMGGILLLCHCAVHGASQIASGAAAAAGLDYSGAGSRYDIIEPLKGLGRLVRRVPAGLLARRFAPLFGRIPNPLEASFCHSPNVAPVAVRAMLSGQYDVSGEVLYQLASLFKPGGLRSLDGELCYSALIGNIETPLLMIAGEKDLQCSPSAAEKTFRRLPGSRHRMLVFGKSFGQPEHYGHFDLFTGLRADREVFPHLHEWLLAHPASV